MAFRPNGIVLNGVLLRSETTLGNLNFYKSVEGFLESFPQAIYQTSILFRTAGKIGNHFLNIFSFIYYVILHEMAEFLTLIQLIFLHFRLN